MQKSVRLLLGILAFLLLIGLAVLGYGALSVRRCWPKTDGTIQLDGLQAEVTVVRDEWGIPHIYASSAHDLFMAQGYIHAQDRFWQMEFWRRIGSGRLSEILGESTLEARGRGCPWPKRRSCSRRREAREAGQEETWKGL